MRIEEFQTVYKECFPESTQGYTKQLRLYVVLNKRNLIKGYAMGISTCGRGQGCFWTPEEVQECTLEEWNNVRRA